jgi:hypothetical protein
MWRQILLAAGLTLGLAGPAAAQQAMFSTWFGGPGDDGIVSAVIVPDGTVLVAVKVGPDLKVTLPGKAPARPSEGLVARLSPISGEIMNAIRLAGAPTDFDADESGALYVTGAFGSAKYDLRGRPVWTSNVGGPDARIAPGPSGSAVVLADKTVTVISPRGSATKSWKVEADVALDVACDTAEQIAYVTGYDNRKGAKDAVPTAFIYAYSGDGKVIWKAYGWTAKELEDAGLAAETRGCRLQMGRDHKLYVAGEGASAATLWQRQPQDLKQKVTLAAGDKFQDSTGAGTTALGFIGRFDSRTGKLEAGTLLLARQSDDKPAALKPRALAVDEVGRVYVGGTAAANPPISDDAFNGKFEGGGAFFTIFDADFRRTYATKLCSGQTNAIGVGAGFIVIAGEGKDKLTPFKPIQKEYGGGESDGWIVLLSRSIKAGPTTPEAAPDKAGSGKAAADKSAPPAGTDPTKGK